MTGLRTDLWSFPEVWNMQRKNLTRKKLKLNLEHPVSVADLGGRGEGLFLDQTEAEGPKKYFLRPGMRGIPPISGSGWPPPPPAPYVNVLIRHCISWSQNWNKKNSIDFLSY